MATIGDINLEEPSTVTKRLAAVEIERNSTAQYQEVMVLGSPNSTTSLALAEVTDSVPASTTMGLVVRVAQPSTGPIAISSIAGPVTVRSSAANALVTVYQSTATDLLARVNQGIGNSSAGDRWRVMTANSSAADYNAVRLVDSSGTGYHGPTNPLPIALTDSSNAVVKAADSANNAIRVNVVAGAAAGSTNVTVSRMVGNSSAGDYMPVRIVNSSGDGFAAPAVDYMHDSTMTASTVTGPGVVLRGSATAPSAISGDDRFVLQWALRNGAAVSALTDANGAIVNTSTSAPSSNAVGIITRPVVSGMQTYAASTTGQSTATTLVSSAAGSKAFVYAYSITSTASTGPVAAGFYDGATLKWPIRLSSGFAGANLAVSPPAYLFSGSTGAALTFNVASTVTGGLTLGVAYWIST